MSPKKRSSSKRVFPNTGGVVAMEPSADRRVTTAPKAEAHAVIAAALGRLARISPRSFDGHLGASIAAAIRYVCSPSADADSAVGRRRHVHQLGEHLERIYRCGSGECRNVLERDCRRLEDDPTVEVGQLIQVLVCLSDVLRAILSPWHHDVSRRFGIVSRADGLPIVTPRLLDGEVLGVSLDELEHRAIPTASYSIVDHDGDSYEVLGPAADAGVGKVSIDRLRAWRSVSLAKLKREMELLPKPSDRADGDRFGPGWPFPTALPGLSNPGVRGADKSVDIVIYLTADKFGVAPSNPLDDDEQDEADQKTNDIPRLPEGFRARSGELVLRAPRQPKSGGKS